MKKLALLLLLPLLAVSLGLPPELVAQAANEQKVHIGYRLKSGQLLELFSDFQGQPNPNMEFLMNSGYYFQIEGSQVEGCDESRLKGKTFTKIWIPGSDEQGARTANRQPLQSTDAKDAKPCPAFPTPDVLPALIGNKQLGAIYWVETTKLAQETLKKDAGLEDKDVNFGKFDRAYLYSKFFASVLAVPFKYRFSYKERMGAFTAESSLGSSVGIKLSGSKYFDQNLWLIGAGGLALINPNSAFDSATTEKKSTQAGVFGAIGIGGNVHSTQFALIYGYDFADKSWEYNAKPWIAFSIGFSFIDREPKKATQ
jgi:hypothetical protein